MKKNKNSKELYLIAQNIRSLFNIGALFRAADIFGVAKIYLTGYTAAPLASERAAKEIAKTALGAEKWIAWEKKWQTHLIVAKLKKSGVKIYALETDVNSTPLDKFRPSFPCALIVGSETTGISKKILAAADEVIFIPMAGKKESLNVAMATGIALYEINKKR